jgi:hypothetical protein
VAKVVAGAVYSDWWPTVNVWWVVVAADYSWLLAATQAALVAVPPKRGQLKMASTTAEAKQHPESKARR